MLNLNQVSLLAGNLTRTPELRYTPDGKAVCEFGIAINGLNNKTTYVDVVVWGKRGEASQRYLEKGSSVFITGRLQLDQWDDRETGKKRNRLKVIAEDVKFVKEMMNLNQLNLAGNLTRSPELRFTNDKKAVCEFGIAINDRENNKTTFVDVVVWGKTAEACEKFLKKGSNALVVGHLQFEQWDNHETGKKASRLKVVAESVQFIGKAPETDK